MATAVQVVRLDDGRFWRMTFGGARGNVLDRATMVGLAEAFREADRSPELKGVVLDGAGPHFSFGASVQEHLPEQVEGMLRTFRDLLAALVGSDLIVVAAVRGQCLGGALELATVCQRIVASEDARFGQPEIALGVFAPVASLLLADRIGQAHAADLCLTGRTVTATEAAAMGLVDEVAADPVEAALAWLRQHLAPKSAKSLRLATRAVRAGLAARLREDLPAIERLYLDELMSTADALEGLNAFLEKRPPAWRDR